MEAHLRLDQAAAEWARCTGNDDPQAWRTLADEWAELRMPYEEAVARFRLAAAHLAGQDGRSSAARQLAGEALVAAARIAADLGAHPLRAEIEDLARRARIPLDGAQTPQRAVVPAAGRDGHPPLSKRELDVLDLLAAGRTNGEIGRALFISTKTASVHVSNILRKLGVSNRVEAAGLAAEVMGRR